MKVSEITTSNVASFLRLENATDPLLTPILAASKSFIESYTNIRTQSFSDEFTADGINNVFKLSEYRIISSTLVVKKNNVTMTLTTDYTVDSISGKVTFVVVPLENDEILITYQTGLDAYEDFWIVVMVLCQDMYDNRTLSVDNENLNQTVKTILDMHSKNLLPKEV